MIKKRGPPLPPPPICTDAFGNLPISGRKNGSWRWRLKNHPLTPSRSHNAASRPHLWFSCRFGFRCIVGLQHGCFGQKTIFLIFTPYVLNLHPWCMRPSCGGSRRMVQKIIDLVHFHNRNYEGATTSPRTWIWRFSCDGPPWKSRPPWKSQKSSILSIFTTGTMKA